MGGSSVISRIDLDLCTGCGICVDMCPTDVLRIDEATQKPVARYIENCMTCYNCERECPTGCIDVSPFQKIIPTVIAYWEGCLEHD
ncbi:ferredoxin family protein [Chloroflexota bacterium]